MMEFLNELKTLISLKDRISIQRLMVNNADAYISPREFDFFCDSFIPEKTKSILKKCININGTGGSGIIKPNITSIACLYLSQITSVPIVKTGSVKNTGYFGSSDFFKEIGVVYSIESIEKDLDVGNFSYLDYLLLSPWKEYYDLLILNHSLLNLFESRIYFDYAANKYALGISNPFYIKNMEKYTIYNAPQKLITYYSVLNDSIIDEIVPNKIFINGINESSKYIQNTVNYSPLHREMIEIINKELLNGECEETFWLSSLRYTVAVLATVLGVGNYEVILEKFDKAYKDKAVKTYLKNRTVG